MRWSPDTCECRVELDMVGNDVVYKSTGACCPVHKGLSGQQLLDTLLAENRQKNTAFGRAKEAISTLEPDHFHYHFDTARTLVVTLDVPISASVRKAIESTPGPNRVRLG